MKGSEKQIKWAEDIKRGAMDTLTNKLERMKNSKHKEYYKITIQVFEELKKELEECFEKVDDAKVIIENRAQFASDRILKMASWREERIRRG